MSLSSPVPSRLRRVALPAVLGVVVALVAACGGHSNAQGLTPTGNNGGQGAHPQGPVLDELTGLPTTLAQYRRPSLAIKIDNLPEARPQAGLDKASLVFEVLVEGGLTRFLAVFHAPTNTLVGPIRSARPVDGALLRALNGGLFAFSGAAAGEIAPAQQYSHADFIDADVDPTPFFGVPGRVAPQDTFSTLAKLYANAKALHYREPPPPQLFDFSATPPAHSRHVRSVLIHLSTYSTAGWVYNPAGHDYLRSEDGTPHVAADGVRITATDVVIMDVRVNHSGIIDAAGNEDPFDQAWGSGAMWVLRDGVLEQGHWSRPSISSRYTFTNAKGGPMTLRPGRIWVEMVPHGGPFPTYGAVQFS